MISHGLLFEYIPLHPLPLKNYLGAYCLSSNSSGVIIAWLKQPSKHFVITFAFNCFLTSFYSGFCQWIWFNTNRHREREKERERERARIYLQNGAQMTHGLRESKCWNCVFNLLNIYHTKYVLNVGSDIHFKEPIDNIQLLFFAVVSFIRLPRWQKR